MVVDRIENLHLYTSLSEDIAKAFGILKQADFTTKKEGRYEADGDNLYYIVQRYTTKPIEQGRLEAHKKYIDIQFVASGEELLGHAPLGNLETDVAYDEAADVAFYKMPDGITTVDLRAGMFCVLFPQDVHMPGCRTGAAANVLKVVIKVRIYA